MGFSFLNHGFFGLLVEGDFCVVFLPRDLIAGPKRGPIQLIGKSIMAQLPAGAEGAAAGVLVWSFTCLLANILLQWLLWTGHERRSCQFFHVVINHNIQISTCDSGIY